VRLLAAGRRPLAWPGGTAPPSPGGRRVAGAGAGFLLAGVGAIMLLAMPTRALPAVNLHVAGIIVIVIGLLWLLLLPRRSTAQRRGLRRWVNPSGIDDPSVHDDQTAAAIDVANIREDEGLSSPAAPDSQYERRCSTCNG
jgi:hypothetical protein